MSLLLPISLLATGGLSKFSGTDGLAVMQIEVNSRVNGLGGAYCAAAEDLSGLSSNPAGISFLTRKEIIFVHYDWLEDTSIEYLAYGQPFLLGVIGGSITYLHVPPFINYNQYGYSIGKISFKNTIYNLAYAQRIGKITVGGQIKFASLFINDFSANSFAIDVGAQYFLKDIHLKIYKNFYLDLNDCKVGMTLQNIATKAYGDIVPIKWKMGFYYPILKNLYLTLDLNKILYHWASFIDLDYRFNVGAEYNFRNLVFVRSGFKLGYDLNFFTIGVGVRYRFGGFETTVDYVYEPYHYLGNINNVSINTKFEKLYQKPALSDNTKKLLELYYYKGLSLFVRENFDGAINEWEKALEIDPDNKVIKKKIKDALDLKEKYNKSREKKKK